MTAFDATNPADAGETASGSGSPITISGLTSGDQYWFKVAATNVVGTGRASTATNSIIPS